MISIDITLLDGTVYTTTVETFDADEMEAKINAQEKVMVAIGRVVLNRHNIKSITESKK